MKNAKQNSAARKAPSPLSPVGRRDHREHLEAMALAEVEAANLRQREKSARLRAQRLARDSK